MGIHACRTVAKTHPNAELIVTDLDPERAAAAASSLEVGATGIALDATDTKALVRAMTGADLVMNTTGPYFRFGVPILRAAMEAGCNYIDVCDDWEPTLDMLALDGAARAAGVTALIGMGATPGVSNLLAVTAARQLDRVDEIVTGWDLTAGSLDHARTPGTSNAAVLHAIAQITGSIRVTRNGLQVDEPALQRIHIDYPGVGARPAWTFGHPEALTLARAFPSLRTCLNVTFAGAAPMAGLRALGWAVDHEVLSARRAELFVDRLDRCLPRRPTHPFREGRLPPLFALAVGIRDDKPATVACALAQIPGGLTMGEATGVPLGVAVALIADGRPGVHAPETLLEPADVFAALAAHCVGHPRASEMIAITRSWDLHAADQLQIVRQRVRRLIARP